MCFKFRIEADQKARVLKINILSEQNYLDSELTKKIQLNRELIVVR